MRPSGFTYVLSESLDATRRDHWDKLLWPGGDPLMDLRFLATVEASMADQTRLWTLIVYDPDRRPVAIACLSRFRADACAMMGNLGQSFSHAVRRLWPGYLYLSILLVGVPVSTGHSGLRITPDTNVPEVLRIVHQVATELAVRQRCVAVMFYNPDDAEAGQWASLSESGYVRVDSLAVNEFPARFRDYDEFCNSIRAHYRRRIAKSRGKFAASGLDLSWQTGSDGAAALYTDEVHRLYENVLQRSTARLEWLPAEFFRKLAAQFGDEARFLFARQGQRTVGFLCVLACGDQYHSLFLGIDYDVNHASDLYFNLLFAGIDDALRRQSARIVMGSTADVCKQYSGCVPSRRHMFLRARGILHPLLRLFAKLLFPPVDVQVRCRLYLRQPADNSETDPADGPEQRVG